MNKFIVIAMIGLGGCVAVQTDEEKEISDRTPIVTDLESATFERVAGPAVKESVFDVGPVGSFYSAYVGSPTVDYDGKVFRMWFVGAAESDDPSVPYGYLEQIGLATSADGLKWVVENEGRPVLSPGPDGSADAKSLSHPYVLRTGGRFMMWYGAIDGTIAGDLGLTPSHVRVERICVATSHDGIHWQRENGGRPGLDIGDENAIDSIQATGMHVLRIDGRFVMWYGAYDGLHTLALATSDDGVHWNHENDGRSLTGLNGLQQLGPSVHFDGQRYFMLYNHGFETSWRAYAAVSDDGVHWRDLPGEYGVLGHAPPGNFAANGDPSNNHSVHPTKMIYHDSAVWTWYTGEDPEHPGRGRIGVMRARLPNSENGW